MVRFGNAMGYLEFKMNSISYRLTPIPDDGYKFAGILASYAKHKGQEQMFKEMGDFIKSLICREYKDITVEEEKELDTIIGFNIIPMIKELSIAFRVTTKEAYEKVEEEEKKKQIVD